MNEDSIPESAFNKAKESHKSLALFQFNIDDGIEIFTYAVKPSNIHTFSGLREYIAGRIAKDKKEGKIPSDAKLQFEYVDFSRN